MTIEIPPHLAKEKSPTGPEILAKERAQASFAPSELQEYLYGREYIEKYNETVAQFSQDPAFDKSKVPFMSRDEAFRWGLLKDKRMTVLKEQNGWTNEETLHYDEIVGRAGAFGLHKSMFIKTLDEQSNEEQRKLFFEPASRYEIIGCYAQTELGHGSNVRGLETTVHYVPEKKKFIVQSPSLTAAKWWIGGLGRTADHAVVMAQLYTPDGKDGSYVWRGPHAFVVPIRDVKTRQMLPGRTIMDIGPKFGYNMTDNGTILFDNVEIPHINFLARFAQVDPDTGKYINPPNAKLSYGTMTYIRANIVKNAGNMAARAATVAIRYCSIRRQFADRDAGPVDGQAPPEVQVLNYQLVQARVLPPLAMAFAYHFTGKEMHRIYHASQSNLDRGDFSTLADVHATACGLKSLTTITTAEAIEQCRRACGGHGYSAASGLHTLYSDFLPQVTWEGDSYMLTQQLGRYLFKTLQTVQANPNASFSAENLTAAYLKKYIANPRATGSLRHIGDLSNPAFFVEAFGHRAAFLISTTLAKREGGASWNSILNDIYRCSVAHSQFFVVYNFAKAITEDPELKSNAALRGVLTPLFQLYAVHTLEKEFTEFLASGYLDSARDQHALLTKKFELLLAEIRPQAVPLVDSWGIADYQLGSVLGRYDGNVYPNLIKFAQQEPLNKVRFNVDYKDPNTDVGPELPPLAKL